MLSANFGGSKRLVVDSRPWVLMLPAHASNWSGLVLPVPHGAGPRRPPQGTAWLLWGWQHRPALGMGRVGGAGALLVLLVVLGAHLSGGQRDSGERVCSPRGPPARCHSAPERLLPVFPIKLPSLPGPVYWGPVGKDLEGP